MEFGLGSTLKAQHWRQSMMSLHSMNVFMLMCVHVQYPCSCQYWCSLLVFPLHFELEYVRHLLSYRIKWLKCEFSFSGHRPTVLFRNEIKTKWTFHTIVRCWTYPFEGVSLMPHCSMFTNTISSRLLKLWLCNGNKHLMKGFKCSECILECQSREKREDGVMGLLCFAPCLSHTCFLPTWPWWVWGSVCLDIKPAPLVTEFTVRSSLINTHRPHTLIHRYNMKQHSNVTRLTLRTKSRCREPCIPRVEFDFNKSINTLVVDIPLSQEMSTVQVVRSLVDNTFI